jgi:hypothetical protein
MMHFERPAEPPGFQEQVRDARRAVEEAIGAGEQPSFDESLWQRHKARFAVAQHSKCAFCEMSIVNHDSAVDHFAPKAEVWELSADDRGHERHEGLPNVRGRTAARAASTGYWWLAYEWRNYLVVCSVCNEKWKRCFFPVSAEPQRWPPHPEAPEEPLLLNPFDDPAPWRHFRFDEAGQMAAAPESVRGRATMDILGFDATSDGVCRRESLRLHREKPAQLAYRHARLFAQSSLTGHRDLAELALETLWRLGSIECVHAGMVRAIAEHVTGFTWDDLMILRGT